MLLLCDIVDKKHTVFDFFGTHESKVSFSVWSNNVEYTSLVLAGKNSRGISALFFLSVPM